MLALPGVSKAAQDYGERRLARDAARAATTNKVKDLPREAGAL